MNGIPALIILALLAFGLPFAAHEAIAAEQSPPPKNLFAPSTASQTGSVKASAPSPVDRVTRYIVEQQRSLYRQFASSLRAAKSEHTVAAIVALIALSFLYGVFHAAGPGHGKAVISAYLLANEQAVKRGIGLSFAASLAQALSAILLVTIMVFALKGFGVTTKQSIGAMTTISAGLIAAIGAWMLWTSIRGVRSRRKTSIDHHTAESSDATSKGPYAANDSAPATGCCGHDHHIAPDHISDKLSLAKAGSIVAAIGLRPCSGAIFVLLFANAIGLYAAGVWSTVAMALGTAITVSGLAVLTLWSKKAAVRLAGGRARWIDGVYGGLSIVGSLAILILGILLMISASGPQTPFP